MEFWGSSVTKNIVFDDLAFSSDFSQAWDNAGTKIDFTKSEIRILSYLSPRPNRIISRSLLLDAISEPGSDKSDRNVDFLINRLRKKLGDDARQPRFIATRYGEGYIWIGSEYKPESSVNEAKITIGPLLGLDELGKLKQTALEFSKALQRSLREEASKENYAGKEVAGRFKSVSGPDVSAVSIELSFFIEAGVLECIIATRTSGETNILDMTRQRVSDGNSGIQEINQLVRAMTPRLWATIWKSRVALKEASIPLPVAMHDAASLSRLEQQSWKKNEIQMQRLRSEHPDDSKVKIMYASHLHSKYVLNGTQLFLNGTANCTRDEDEIERLVLESLPFTQTRPDLAIIAAKLLFFLDRGYRDFAVEMAEEAHTSNTNIAASLAVVGQMRAFIGQHEEAVACLNQAAKLGPRGSEFHVYTLVMKCQALMAAGHWEALAKARKELYRVRPVTMIVFELWMTDPAKPSLGARTIALSLSRARATAILMHFNYTSTRLFENMEHRENSMRAMLGLLVDHHSADVIPETVRKTVPGLIRD